MHLTLLNAYVKNSMTNFDSTVKGFQELHSLNSKEYHKLIKEKDAEKVRNGALERLQFNADMLTVSKEITDQIELLEKNKRDIALMKRQTNVHIRYLEKRFTPVVFK